MCMQLQTNIMLLYTFVGVKQKSKTDKKCRGILVHKLFSLFIHIMSVLVYDEINSLTVGPPLHSNPAYEKPTNMKCENNPAYELAYNPTANPPMKIAGMYFLIKNA